MVRLMRVCRGQSTWHEKKEELGTWEDSCSSSNQTGRKIQPNKKDNQKLAGLRINS